jgi:YVTN family beta-propeller protein
MALAAIGVFVLAGACRNDPSIRITPVPGRPSAVAVLDELVWVTDDERHAVHAVEASSGDRATEPFDVERNPVAIAAGRGAIWVAHASGTVVRVDPRTGRPGKPLKAGGSLTGIAVAGNRVWVTDISTSSLIEIDAKTSRIRRVFRLANGAVRVAPAGDVLWVTGRERSVTRVDPRSGKVGPSVEVGLGPIGLAYDGKRVWVANSDDGTVSRIDATSGKRAGAPVRVGGGPIGVAVAGGSVWVANQDDLSLTRIDPDQGRVVGEPVDIGSSLRGITAGRGAVWVVGTNPSALVRVEP